MGSTRSHHVDTDAVQPVARDDDRTVSTAAESGVRDPLGEDGPTLTRGSMLGRYVVLDRIGVGGMGVVHAAYDPDLDRKVALKVMLPYMGSVAGGQVRLLREAQALARLSHPNVVTVHDVGSVGTQVFLAMELVEGQTLGAWLRERARPWRAIVDTFIEAGKGLAAAHAAGVIHRDFKPSNVLVGADGRVRVMDFGLARAGHEPASAGEGPGAPVPTAPSQLRSPEPSVDGRSDRDSDRGSDGRADRGSDGRSEPGSDRRSEPGSDRRSEPGSRSPRGALHAELTVAGSLLGTPKYMPPEAYRSQPTEAAADQFSYCVALYEALYGHPPFPIERSPADDARWVPHAPPRGSAVPSWIADLVMRGLASSPGDRHPSMRALVEALGRDPRRNQRRVLAMGALVMLGLGAWGVVHLQRARAAAGCDREGAQLSRVWSSTRADAVGAAFAGTGIGYAADTWSRARARLDHYARDWRATRIAVCTQAELDGTLATEPARQARACLDEARDELDALLEPLARPDATMIQKTATASASLTPLDACTDPTRTQHRAEPAEASVRTQVARLRARLARASAVALTGHFDQSLALAQAVRDDAAKVGWAPLEAEAAVAVGEAHSGLGNFEQARIALEAGFFAAGAAGRDELALRAASKLVFVVGYRLALPDDGLRWGRLAQMLVDRSGRANDLAVASLLNNLAVVHGVGRGEQAKAIELLQRAVHLREHHLGPEHPLVAMALSNLGLAYVDHHEDRRALPLLERALTIRALALGPEHPEYAVSLNNVGRTLLKLGKPDEALVLLERAVAIREKALGPEHPDLADLLNNLGQAHAGRGDHRLAQALYERALAIQHKAYGAEHPAVADSLCNLGRAHADQGDPTRALALYQQALEIRQKMLGAEHPDVAEALESIGRLRYAQTDVPGAVRALQRALAIREHLGAAPTDLAALRFALARAQWDAGADPAAAIALASASRDAYATDHDDAPALAEVTQWLAAHPPR